MKPWRCRHCGQSPEDDVFPLAMALIFCGLPVAFVAGLLFAVWKMGASP